MWGMESDRLYDAAMEILLESVLNYLDKHPELKNTLNIVDMFDFRNREEDVDDTYKDEDEWGLEAYDEEEEDY